MMLRHHPVEEFEEPALGIIGYKLLKPVFDLMAADVDLAEAIELFAIARIAASWRGTGCRLS